MASAIALHEELGMTMSTGHVRPGDLEPTALCCTLERIGDALDLIDGILERTHLSPTSSDGQVPAV